MADARYSVPPPLDAERIIAAQLVDHARRLDDQGRPTGGCRVCGRLPAGLTLTCTRLGWYGTGWSRRD